MNITPINLVSLKNVVNNKKTSLQRRILFTQKPDTVEFSSRTQQLAEAQAVATMSKFIKHVAKAQYKDVSKVFSLVKENGLKDLETENGFIKVRTEKTYLESQDNNEKPQTEGSIILAEYNKAGSELLRTSTFGLFGDEYKLKSITENSGINRLSYSFDENGNIKDMTTKKEELPNGTQKIAEKYCFNKDGSLCFYEEGIEHLPDGTQKIAKRIDFKNNEKAGTFQSGCQLSSDGKFTVAEKFDLRLF